MHGGGKGGWGKSVRCGLRGEHSRDRDGPPYVNGFLILWTCLVTYFILSRYRGVSVFGIAVFGGGDSGDAAAATL